MNHNFDIAQKKLKHINEQERLTKCFEKAKESFNDLAKQNSFTYTSLDGFITKNLIEKGQD